MCAESPSKVLDQKFCEQCKQEDDLFFSDAKRWLVVAIYRIRPSRPNVRAWVEYIKTWEIEELDELEELIELGPEWCALVDIRITLQKNAKPGFIIGSDLDDWEKDGEDAEDAG